MGKIIIIGGGASGIACALKLKLLNPNFHVTILEQNPRIGKKILKTGNGRCNIGNLNIRADFYNNQEFINQCLDRFTVKDLFEFFLDLGLLLKSDDHSRIYPYSESATTVLDVFLAALKRLDVDVICNQRVLQVRREKRYKITTEDSEYETDALVFATGSIAQEQTNGYEIIRGLGHRITPLCPGLVPIKVAENLKSLQGLRVKCLARIRNGVLAYSEEGEILFKDQGLSGILSLNLSRYVKEGSIISLDLLPLTDKEEEIRRLLEARGIKDGLIGVFPKMLVYEIINRNPEGIPEDILRTIHQLDFHVTGVYGFSSAQITIGGVDLKDINPDFSSKKDNTLSIIGEVLDIDGASGGYNLHFAWMSGILAAVSISSKIEKK